MALLPERGDVRALLGRIRVGADWGWRGGVPNDTAQVDWRDRVQREPTEAQYLAELAVVDTEIADRVTTRVAQRSRSVTLVGLDPSDLTPTEVRDAVEELLAFFGALGDDGLILPIEQWFHGSRRPPGGVPDP